VSYTGYTAAQTWLPFLCLLLYFLSAIITLVNCISVRWAVIMQNLFTAAKLAGVGIIIVIGFIEMGKGKKKKHHLYSTP